MTHPHLRKPVLKMREVGTGRYCLPRHSTHFETSLLEFNETSFDGASNVRHYVIQRILIPHSLSSATSYNVKNCICQALSSNAF